MHKNFEVKDHSITQETFTLHYDDTLHMYHTHPKPLEKKLSRYYNSEDYISHTDGKRSLFEKIYQYVKKIMLSRKHKLIKKYHPENGELLDLGAGTGDFVEYISKQNWKLVGVEPSKKARSLAQKKGFTFFSDISKLENKKYDVITMWHVLEHVYDLDEQIYWLKKNLSKEGTIFIAVPNFESYDASHYKEYWAAYDVPRHLYHFSQQSIETLFGKYGFEVVSVKPMKFDAYYVSLLSEKYKNSKSNFFKAVKVGFTSNTKARSSGQYSSKIYVIKRKNI